MNSKHCFTCGGYGFRDKECPECNKIAGNLDVFNNDERAIQYFVNKTDFLEIPKQYTGIQWHKDYIKSDCKHLEKDVAFQRFITQIEKFHNIFGEGRIPGRSVLICGSQGMSKQTLAYSCMQLAIQYGFKVAPLLDTTELKRLLIISTENPRYKYCGKIDVDNYITSDVLFVTVAKSSHCKEAYLVLQDIMDKRTRKGLPTFVISRYSLQEMSEFDDKKEFVHLLDARYNKENALKFPTVLSYFENYK
ncbi:hypothetical protein [uncultured Clostridium sp.]|uniref:hypothetical protein n=1 Tax=uncultured Clostridium sp. TaxID=59620 RepID=UPI0026F39436|nr:hypothetical protein [uncultured Clostridium sp.]